MERYLHDPDRAVNFAQQAIKLDPSNPSLKNTLGFALELAGRTANDKLKKQALLGQAKRAFEEGCDRDPSNAFNYIGLALVRRTEASTLPFAERTVVKAELLAFLEEAYQVTGKSEIIAKALAEEQKDAGEPVEALQLVEQALKTKEDDTRLRVLHVKLLQTIGKFPEALQSALIGLRHEPNSWLLNAVVARLLRKTNGQVSAIRGHYEAARRHKTRDFDLLVEYGAYLYTVASYRKADEVFAEAQRIPADIDAKRKVRAWWKSPGSNSDEVFVGSVKAKRGSQLTLLATPLNFEVDAWQNDVACKVGDSLRFSVSFTAFGPKARVIGQN